MSKNNLDTSSQQENGGYNNTEALWEAYRKLLNRPCSHIERESFIKVVTPLITTSSSNDVSIVEAGLNRQQTLDFLQLPDHNQISIMIEMGFDVKNSGGFGYSEQIVRVRKFLNWVRENKRSTELLTKYETGKVSIVEEKNLDTSVHQDSSIVASQSLHQHNSNEHGN